MTQRLSAMVANVRSNTALVAHAGEQLASGNHELSKRTGTTSRQPGRDRRMSVQELKHGRTTEPHTPPLKLNQLTHQVRSKAEQGHVTHGIPAVESMAGIQEGSRKVQDIVGVIDGIAFQTNILVLNAAVEAARAGDQAGDCRGGLPEVRVLAAVQQRRRARNPQLGSHTLPDGWRWAKSGVQRPAKLLQEVLAGAREVMGKIESIRPRSSRTKHQPGAVVASHRPSGWHYPAKRTHGGCGGQYVQRLAWIRPRCCRRRSAISSAPGHSGRSHGVGCARIMAHIRQRLQQAMQDLTDPARIHGP